MKLSEQLKLSGRSIAPCHRLPCRLSLAPCGPQSVWHRGTATDPLRNHMSWIYPLTHSSLLPYCVWQPVHSLHSCPREEEKGRTLVCKARSAPTSHRGCHLHPGWEGGLSQVNLCFSMKMFYGPKKSETFGLSASKGIKREHQLPLAYSLWTMDFLNTWCGLIHSVLTTGPWGLYSYPLPFPHEEVETQTQWVACSRSQSSKLRPRETKQLAQGGGSSDLIHCVPYPTRHSNKTGNFGLPLSTAHTSFLAPVPL